MDKVITIIQTALPVFLALAFGMYARKKGTLSRSSIDAMKHVVINITLPFVLLDAILQVFPLDTYVEKPAILMEKMDCDKDLVIPVWDTYKEIIAKYDDRGAAAVGQYERFKFYDEAQDCYCIIQTGETAIYANIILQKGVIK